MTKPPRFVVSEQTAKCMRIWEELGGPDYLTLDNAREVFASMTDVEQREVPTWRQAADKRLNVQYVLPKRFNKRWF